MKRQKIIYYQDELNDEFSTAKITPRKIDGGYRYLPRGSLCFFWYRIVATPLAFLYTKLFLRHTVKGAKTLRKYAKGGCFCYGNHTQAVGDALIPSMLAFPSKAYVIVHPANVSMPALGRVTPSLGALPLPDDLAAYRNFIKALDTVSAAHPVFIYPEAHIWPYYTGIRPFSDGSFVYPLRSGAPVFAFTNTYQRGRFFKRPKTVTYVDGPFYPDQSLPPSARKKDLRDRVYNAMCARAKNSDVNYIEYRKMEEKNG